MAEPRELVSILSVLLDEGVELVLVGALAAVAQGAPITTHDVDIVHARTPDNLDRLMTALAKLNARYRGRPASSPLGPDRAALATPGHSLFMTNLGPLDCLGSIENAIENGTCLDGPFLVQSRVPRAGGPSAETIRSVRRSNRG
jgi:hypothetical protein